MVYYDLGKNYDVKANFDETTGTFDVSSAKKSTIKDITTYYIAKKPENGSGSSYVRKLVQKKSSGNNYCITKWISYTAKETGDVTISYKYKETVADELPDKYPEDGEHDGLLYVKNN